MSLATRHFRKDFLMHLFFSIPSLMLWSDGADLGSAGNRLIHLNPVDIAIIAIYFAMVLGIGFYLKNHTKSGDDFFLAGPRNDGLGGGAEFRFRQPWRAGTDGLGGGHLSVRHPGDALVLDWRHSRHPVSRPRADAVLLHLQNPFGSRLPSTSVRRTDPRASAPFPLPS